MRCRSHVCRGRRGEMGTPHGVVGGDEQLIALGAAEAEVDRPWEGDGAEPDAVGGEDLHPAGGRDVDPALVVDLQAVRGTRLDGGKYAAVVELSVAADVKGDDMVGPLGLEHAGAAVGGRPGREPSRWRQWSARRPD